MQSTESECRLHLGSRCRPLQAACAAAQLLRQRGARGKWLPGIMPQLRRRPAKARIEQQSSVPARTAYTPIQLSAMTTADACIKSFIRIDGNLIGCCGAWQVGALQPLAGLQHAIWGCSPRIAIAIAAPSALRSYTPLNKPCDAKAECVGGMPGLPTRCKHAPCALRSPITVIQRPSYHHYSLFHLPSSHSSLRCFRDFVL